VTASFTEPHFFRYQCSLCQKTLEFTSHDISSDITFHIYPIIVDNGERLTRPSSDAILQEISALRQLIPAPQLHFEIQSVHMLDWDWNQPDAIQTLFSEMKYYEINHPEFLDDNVFHMAVIEPPIEMNSVANVGGKTSLLTLPTLPSHSVFLAGLNFGFGIAEMDPNFPHPNVGISEKTDRTGIFGFHQSQRILFPPETSDIMSLDFWRWSSDYFFNKSISYLSSLSSRKRQVTSGPASSILIELSPAGGKILKVVNFPSDTVTYSEDNGLYMLNFKGGAGNILQTYHFHPDESISGSSISLTTTTIILAPYFPVLSTIELVSPMNRILDIFTVSSTPPTLQLVHPLQPTEISILGPESTLKIEWQGQDMDGDDLDYRVSYWHNGGNRITLIAEQPVEDHVISASDLLAGNYIFEIMVLQFFIFFYSLTSTF